MSSPSPLHKALIRSVAIGGASVLLITPLLASASFISSLLSGTASHSSASDATYNSQTVPLLASASNSNPNPIVAPGPEIVAGQALISKDNPVATGDVPTRPLNPHISVYTVHDGDTLSMIAAMFDVPIATIVGANDIQNGVVHPGQQLIILPIAGVEHTVVAGDTLASLAKKYNSNADGIAQYNSVASGGALTVGAKLLIPGGEVSAPVVKKTSTKTVTKSKTKTISKSSVPAEPYLGGSGPDLGNYFGWPVSGGIVTQALHGWNAVDIGAPQGTAIYAAAGGTVIIAKNNGAWNGGYGNYVVISHPNGTETLYGHMSKVLASVGDIVAQGEVIGKVGQTGLATGPHLHFEIRGAENPFASHAVGSSD